MKRAMPQVATLRSQSNHGWALLALLLVAFTAGCWNSATPTASTTPKTAAEKLKEKKTKRPFDQLRVFSEPNEKSQYDPLAKENERIVTAIKPGHWTGVLVQTRANLFDFSGELTSSARDAQNQPVALERELFWLTTTRSVTLAKEQRKSVETLFFAPRPATDSNRRSTWILNRLASGANVEEVQSSDPLSHMPGFQYFMVVLAREPARYSYLRVLDSVRPPYEYTLANIDDICYYRVLLPATSAPLALPNQPLCWTNLAYLVWDDILPKSLTPEQQQALVAWLHWGGGLIVSGPDSLDKLKGSFLEPYLAATGGAAGPIEPTALTAWGDAWTLKGDQSRRPGSNGPWSGVTLEKHPAAEFLPGTGNLVAERRVGLGRVVVTSFRLSEPDLVTWRSYDGFFNSGLLRRPPRRFEQQRVNYAGANAPDRFDAETVTNVRIFTRDAREIFVRTPEPKPDPLQTSATNSFQFSNSQGFDPKELDEIDRLKRDSGVAGWNDFSWISNIARQTLRDAAGIHMPDRTFVAKMVGLYLLAIVVFNWLVFRVLGKVEWAWIAVPVIAVAGGVMVVWLAQLDIGFARAETEVAVLEVQEGFERGHLTRYTALYSSLSTNYDLAFKEPSAVAQPFSIDQAQLTGQSPQAVTFESTGRYSLRDFPVASNSTGMVHSEEFTNLGGAIHWEQQGDQTTVTNGTRLPLVDAAIVRRRVAPGGAAFDETAWIGDLAPGAKHIVTFAVHKKAEHAKAREQGTPVEADRAAGLNLRKLLDAVEDHRSLAPGEVRLVARHPEGLPGMQVSPESNQTRRATLVVAHLVYPLGDEPPKDENLRVRARQEDNTGG